MRNSSLSKLPWQNAFKTSSASPHRCGRTFTPFCARASSNGSDNAAHSRTSACNSATPLASASVDSGLSTHSVRSTSLPRQIVTTSIRDAVSSTGEIRPCDVGRATFTTSPDATSVPLEVKPGSFPANRPQPRVWSTGRRWVAAKQCGKMQALAVVAVAYCEPRQQPPSGLALTTQRR